MHFLQLLVHYVNFLIFGDRVFRVLAVLVGNEVILQLNIIIIITVITYIQVLRFIKIIIRLIVTQGERLLKM